MNRRSFIQLSLLASAGTLLSNESLGVEKTSSPRRAKRGLGIGPRKDAAWRQKLSAVGASWFYTWTPNPPENIPAGMEFIPMIYGRMSEEKLAMAGETFRRHQFKELLGFNEPDQKKQGDVPLEEALALWPKLMEFGLRLGSPACVHPDNDWMKAFMKRVDEQALRVDFVTVHSYGGLNADALMKKLEEIHALYRRPLWITEFGVGDWKAKTRAENRYRPDQIVTFMEKILPSLDACDFVERYAWFAPNPDNAPLGPCALFNDDGTMTGPGEAYRTL